MGLPVVIFRA